MEQKHDFKKIEKKWQKEWRKKGVYEPNLKKAKQPFYNLMMFPYPSAEGLHVGNMYAFTGSDIYGRFKRMQGNDVFEPIGLDGFGIHSENYALKIGKHPMDQAKVSEKRFYKQLEAIGNGFAWNEHLETYDPEYYRWTQWIFAQMFKSGLAYRKKQPVNWCPSCKTVLADEQVINGQCERCGTKVIKKELEQWFFKITDYAERLLNNIEALDWSEKIKIAQRSWIGKSEGTELGFEVRTKEKSNFILLHGYTGRADKNFIPSLKRKLQTQGFKVQAPQLPNTNFPKEAEQVGYILKNCRIDRHTIIVGHSLGGVVAMKVLQKINRSIAGLILVAPAMEPKFRIGAERPFWKTFSFDYDYEKIKKLSGFRMIFSDTLEKNKRGAYLAYLSKKISAPIYENAAEKEHFTGNEESFLVKNLTPSITVFTTRPDTLFGATYMVLAPEHSLIQNLKSQITNWKQVEAYVKKAANKDEAERIAEGGEKTGVELKGITAINPVTKKKIPVWVADYVLAGYGTGAIMAVPAHDERDFEFAKKFKLPITTVIEPETGEKLPNEEFRKSIVAIVEDPKTKKYLTLNWGSKLGGRLFVGGGIEGKEDAAKAALREIKEETGYSNVKLISRTEKTHHHYFAFSKNRGRETEAIGLYFQLKNDVRGAQKLESHEHGNFKLEWVTKDEVLSSMEDENHLLVFHRLVLGEPHTGHGRLMNSGKFNGMPTEKARWEITKAAGGKKKTKYRLRDWLISRQRYWGPPIPMIYCESCATKGTGERKDMPGWYAESKFPVKLPYVKDFRPKGKGTSPLASVKSFYEVKCPHCKAKARRETDVSDTFLDSAWYYLRYLDPKNNKKVFDPKIAEKWLPADMYIGGAEHAVLHLLYVRFVAMVLHDLGLVKFDEPFKRFRAHGLLIKEGAKMSKSKGNVVNPDEYIEKFGADALRMYLMFLAPFEQGGDFRDQGLLGITRFLERVARFPEKIVGQDANTKILHQTIKKVTEDIESLAYNTAISALMILLNDMEKNGAAKHEFEAFLKLLAPFAPHLAEEMWSSGGHKGTIHAELWPKFDPVAIEEDTFTLVIQVNGKVRDSIEASTNLTEEEARILAMSREKIKEFLNGAEPKKFIYVPKRIINIVI